MVALYGQRLCRDKGYSQGFADFGLFRELGVGQALAMFGAGAVKHNRARLCIGQRPRQDVEAVLIRGHPHRTGAMFGVHNPDVRAKPPFDVPRKGDHFFGQGSTLPRRCSVIRAYLTLLYVPFVMLSPSATLVKISDRAVSGV